MGLAVVAGNANPTLAEAVCRELGVSPLGRVIERFPDSELHVELGVSVRGQDVYVVQPTSPPVDEHLTELLFLADACRRAGAATISAVVPYFGYARQDRRARGREAVPARLVADLIAASGVRRLIAVDLHTPSLEGFFPVPLEHLTAVPLLAKALPPLQGASGVVVAPDLGAVKLAERYAALLRLPMAVVLKTRLGPESVRAEGVVGEVRGRTPIIVDDMISTGGTIEAAVRCLEGAGARPDATVLVTHLLLAAPGLERLASLGLRRLISSDSVLASADRPALLEVVSLAPLIAETMRRLASGGTLADLAWHG